MKVTAAVSIAFAGSALAAGAADTVNQILTQIASDIKEFDAAVKAYSGNTANMMAAAKKIEQTTTSGAQTISAGADLTLTDAVGITSNVQGLQTTLDGALSDLKAIGDKLAANGECSTVLNSLASQAKAAKSLQDAITSKAPADTKAVAQQLGGAVGASIQDTTAFFKKTCENAPSSPSGGMSGSHGGGHSDSPSSGSSSGTSSGSSSGSKTNKASKTSTVPKPATYTGAANTLTAPFLGALALAVFAL